VTGTWVRIRRPLPKLSIDGRDVTPGPRGRAQSRDGRLRRRSAQRWAQRQMWCGQTQRRCTRTRLPVSIVNLYFFIKAALFVSIRSALNVVSVKFNKNKLLYVRKLAQENKERIIFLALKIVMFSFFALFPLKLSYLAPK
jgi:hypothetical protein